MIIEHADVRRMLLAQKVYAEGSLSLCLYGSWLFENSQTAASSKDRDEAQQLLDLLTPIIKSYPSRYGCVANELAIQVHGGAGYTREYPVEQLYRDQRLNPIHEGTEAIHGIDLLGRKIHQPGYGLFLAAAGVDITTAKQHEACNGFAVQLTAALTTLEEVTTSLQQQMAQDIDRGLANATLYLDLFGRTVMAWIWLQQANSATVGLEKPSPHIDEVNFYRGKLQAARYFFDWELPAIVQQAAILIDGNSVPFDMQNTWY